jgi:hypothetical protein
MGIVVENLAAWFIFSVALGFLDSLVVWSPVLSMILLNLPVFQ